MSYFTVFNIEQKKLLVFLLLLLFLLSLLFLLQFKHRIMLFLFMLLGTVKAIPAVNFIQMTFHLITQ